MNFLGGKLQKFIAVVIVVSYLGFGMLGFVHSMQMITMNMTMDDFSPMPHWCSAEAPARPAD